MDNIDVSAYADATRGLAILLVVFGHVPGRLETPSEILNWIVKTIYMFHVPLLFFASGFTAGLSSSAKHEQFGTEYVVKRFRRLMIPYFVMNLFYLALQVVSSSFMSYNRSVDYNLLLKMITDPPLGPMGPLWFLYVLFGLSIVFSILNALLQDGVGSHPIIFLITSLALNLVPWPEVFGIKRVFFYMPFFVAGAICFRHSLLDRNNPVFWFVASLGLFLFFVFFQNLPLPSLPLSILVGFVGCVAALSGIQIVVGHNRGSFFVWIGKYAMGVYVLHMLIITVWSQMTQAIYHRGLSLMSMSVMFFLSVFVPILIVRYIILPSSLLTKIVLGAPVRK